jgi:hypothetical protein
VLASPIVVVIVPRTRLLFYGDPVFAEDQVCLEAANRRSERSLRGEFLSVRKCCCCHVDTILYAPLSNARAAAEAAAAVEEDHKVMDTCVGSITSILGGPASSALLSPGKSHLEGTSTYFVIVRVRGVGISRYVLSCRSARARGSGRTVARASEAAAA